MSKKKITQKQFDFILRLRQQLGEDEMQLIPETMSGAAKEIQRLLSLKGERSAPTKKKIKEVYSQAEYFSKKYQ